MQTGKNDEEKYKKMQDLYAELIANPDAKNYFEAETKFNIVIADINKIIGEAIKRCNAVKLLINKKVRYFVYDNCELLF